MARYSGKNVGLYYTDGGASEVQVLQLVSVSGPDSQLDDIEYTELGQQDKQFLPGLTDNGEIDFVVNLDPNLTSHAWLNAHAGDTDVTWRINHTVFNYTFAGYLKGNALEELVGGSPLRATFKIKINGAVTRTAVAP